MMYFVDVQVFVDCRVILAQPFLNRAAAVYCVYCRVTHCGTAQFVTLPNCYRLDASLC